MKKLMMTVLAFVCMTSLARAQQTRGYRGGGGGEDELDAMIGGRVGVDNSPGGGLVGTEYAHRLSQQTWFDLQLDMSFGGTNNCWVNRAGFVDCGQWGGQSLDIIAGVKWKFQTRNERLVPFAKVGGGLAFLFWPGPDNDGIAPVVRGGGGVKYFVLPNLGLGGEMSAMLGPGFYGCGPNCTFSDLFFAFNIVGSVEFDF
jgi:hypothetical protein